MDELSNLKEGYAQIECRQKDYETQRKKLLSEIERYRVQVDNLEESTRAIREENIALKDQIEAYRFCIENLGGK